MIGVDTSPFHGPAENPTEGMDDACSGFSFRGCGSQGHLERKKLPALEPYSRPMSMK